MKRQEYLDLLLKEVDELQAKLALIPESEAFERASILGKINGLLFARLYAINLD